MKVHDLAEVLTALQTHRCENFFPIFLLANPSNEKFFIRTLTPSIQAMCPTHRLSRLTQSISYNMLEHNPSFPAPSSPQNEKALCTENKIFHQVLLKIS